MAVVLVAAVGRNGVIGVDGHLPWRIPEDMARFKSLTMGGVLVMGRATYESIGRPLPGRDTVVLTRRKDWSAEGVEVVGSLDEAIGLAVSRGKDAFIAGGSAVYGAALGVADRMELTQIDAAPDGDTYFPEVDWDDWVEETREDRDGYSFVTYRRS